MGPVFVILTPLFIIVFAFLMSQIEKYFTLWGNEALEEEELQQDESVNSELLLSEELENEPL